MPDLSTPAGLCQEQIRQGALRNVPRGKIFLAPPIKFLFFMQPSGFLPKNNENGWILPV